LPSGLTTQGSGVRGGRARLSFTPRNAKPRIPCSRLLGRDCALNPQAGRKLVALHIRRGGAKLI
jgi:hypothetical protein